MAYQILHNLAFLNPCLSYPFPPGSSYSSLFYLLSFLRQTRLLLLFQTSFTCSSLCLRYYFFQPFIWLGPIHPHFSLNFTFSKGLLTYPASAIFRFFYYISQLISFVTIAQSEFCLFITGYLVRCPYSL